MEPTVEDNTSPCNRKEDKQRIKIKGFGMEADISGSQLAHSGLVLIIGILLCGGLYIHDKNTIEAMNSMVKVQKAMVYMIKLNQEGRDKLDLDKPELIREMEARARLDRS